MTQTDARPPYPSRNPLLEKQLWMEASVNKGMVTVIDPADIDDAALTDAKNVRIRFDKTSRRSGFTAFAPVDDNIATVMDMVVYKKNNGDLFVVKLTPAGPRYTNLTTWFVPTGTGLAGSESDRFAHTIAQDLFIFANNGVDFIQSLVTGSPGTFARLGNAPKARFLTSFYNRIIAANYTAGGTPVTLGWSGDLNAPEWDPLVDISAGSAPLVESPEDEADFLTGVFGFTNVLVVMRERSVWMATKQPIASDPFFFSSVVAGVGSSCPYSIAVIPGGLIWVDTVTGTVWGWELGGTPERIGLPVERDIMKSITDPTQIIGTYSALNNEYTACIFQASTGTRKIWTFNFRSKAWSYDEIDNVFSLSDIYALKGVITIGQLTGLISGLTGSIGNLSVNKPTSTTRVIGKNGGIILVEDPTSDVDEGANVAALITIGGLLGTIAGLAGTIATLSGGSPVLTPIPYETVIASKDFVFPQVDKYVSEVKIEYIAHMGGSMLLEYSKDSGSNWKLVKTITVSELEVIRFARFVGQYKARRFRWRVRASDGQFDILSYEVHVYAGGESRNK